MLRALADQVMVLRACRVVEQGPAQQIFDHPARPYTRALMAAALALRAPEA